MKKQQKRNKWHKRNKKRPKLGKDCLFSECTFNLYQSIKQLPSALPPDLTRQKHLASEQTLCREDLNMFFIQRFYIGPNFNLSSCYCLPLLGLEWDLPDPGLILN